MPINVIPVETDNNGMKASTLRICLEKMKQQSDKNFPKLLYTIPNCSNPTGVSADEERKREIYKVNCFSLILYNHTPHSNRY